MTYTKQQTFNIVAKHLLTQRKKSKKPGLSGQCLYRGPNGKQCAVGCLIPDDKYHRGIEGDSADGDLVGGLLRNLGHDIELCEKLQSIHDAFHPNQWPQQLRQIAEFHSLDGSVIEEVRNA